MRRAIKARITKERAVMTSESKMKSHNPTYLWENPYMPNETL